MAKLNYEKPIIEFFEFVSEDIIVTSGGDNDIVDEWETDNESGDGLGEFH